MGNVLSEKFLTTGWSHHSLVRETQIKNGDSDQCTWESGTASDQAQISFEVPYLSFRLTNSWQETLEVKEWLKRRV